MQTIMIVEDDPDIRDGVRILLSGEGYRILDNITSNLLNTPTRRRTFPSASSKRTAKPGLPLQMPSSPAGTSPSGTVKSMVQLVPANIDKLGAASAMSGSKRYELADDRQVSLWYKGQYYATTLSQVNAEDYHLIGWYDSLGCAAGGKIRVLIAVKND